MSSLVTNLNRSTAQEIVNWVMTADGCVHTADATQLDTVVSRRRRRCVFDLTLRVIGTVCMTDIDCASDRV